MSISAKVIADSVSPAGKRLTTMQLRYPKFVHGEVLTHRAFSRSSSSSRAVPFERMVQDVIDDPATPVWWGKNQPGMQARTELDAIGREWALHTWLEARDVAVAQARQLHRFGLHKQVVNRVVEPFAHINTLVTATEYDNFFALRCHPDAQPEMRVLAEAMRDAMAASTPAALEPGQWHLPYVDVNDPVWDWSDAHTLWNAVKTSVARCARVSYLTHEGRPTTVGEDLALYDRLAGAVPAHLSPMEHQATPDENFGEVEPGDDRWGHPAEHGNLVGWRQLRRQLEPGT
jgi:thymidylate synthase ThyX